MDKLPNSPALKCYFLCNGIEMGLMRPNSTRIYTESAMEFIDKFNDQEQKNILKLSRGCLSKVRKLKDPLEVAYQSAVCTKQNDNEVSIFSI